MGSNLHVAFFKQLRENAQQRTPADKNPRFLPLSLNVTLQEDRRQRPLFPTTIDGGARVKSSDKWRVTLRQAQGRLSDQQVKSSDEW